MSDKPKPVPRIGWHGLTTDEQRVRAARAAMFQQMLKEALDG